jgi:adenine-specific DNA-methyltransferase
MEKLKLHSPDLTQANIDKIAALFPNCMAEARDANGVVTKSIDFDQLRQELSGSIVEGPQERYQLNWPGKREALLTANAPIAKTLRPCREESVDFDTTQNLFIEGDNLDALKLLQETYLNKVKLIYIDPPYNTGNDFIYEDDFAEDADSYFLKSNQIDERQNRMVANTENNGRKHSDWLSMLYPRLKLARNLLSKDGVIFISIDDSEYDNLRKLCVEIFGEKNFVGVILWKTDEYIRQNYSNPDNDPNGLWTTSDLSANHEGPLFEIVNPKTQQSYWPAEGRYWVFNEAEVKRRIVEGRIIFGKTGNAGPIQKKFLKDRDGARTKPESWWDKHGMNSDGSQEIAELFVPKVFDHPKPTTLLRKIVDISSKDDDIVLDFFAGSGSTPHAVLAQNQFDGFRRKFIAVQLPELLADNSIAKKKCGFEKISDLTKERIRRAGGKIKKDFADKPGIDKLDVGFRVLKVDTSNMKEVFYTPDAVSQDLLSDQVNNIREDRTSEDLLFQVLLDWGVDLALPIAKETIAGKTVYFVDGNALTACFDEGVNEEFVKLLAKREPLRVVFRDAGFASDSVKINVEQIFKLMSPSTEVKCI